MILHQNFPVETLECKYGSASQHIETLALAFYVFVKEDTKPYINKSIPVAIVTYYLKKSKGKTIFGVFYV